MSRRFVSLLCLLTITCNGLVGCASGFGFNKPPFWKSAQKEPKLDDDDDVDENPTENWQKEAAQMRGEAKRKPSSDSWLDDLIWSKESRDIGRSLNADL
jgi:hypothetical protein